MNLHSVLLWLPVKPLDTSLSVHVHLDTEETPLIPTLAATRWSVKLTTIALPTWLVIPRHKGVSILVQLLPVEKDLVGLKTTNQSATVNLVSSLLMDNVWTLTSVPSLVLVTLQLFAVTLLDPSPVLAQKEVLEMPEHQDANPEESALMTEIVPQHLLAEKADVLILALVNVALEPLVKSLGIRPSAHVQCELEAIQGLNVDNWNVWKTPTVLLEDLVSRTSALMLAASTVFAVSMPSVPS